MIEKGNEVRLYITVEDGLRCGILGGADVSCATTGVNLEICSALGDKLRQFGYTRALLILPADESVVAAVSEKKAIAQVGAG